METSVSCSSDQLNVTNNMYFADLLLPSRNVESYMDKCRRKTLKCINSRPFLITICVLVVVECACVLAELMVDLQGIKFRFENEETEINRFVLHLREKYPEAFANEDMRSMSDVISVLEQSFIFRTKEDLLSQQNTLCACPCDGYTTTAAPSHSQILMAADSPSGALANPISMLNLVMDANNTIPLLNSTPSSFSNITHQSNVLSSTLSSFLSATSLNNATHLAPTTSSPLLSSLTSNPPSFSSRHATSAKQSTSSASSISLSTTKESSSFAPVNTFDSSITRSGSISSRRKRNVSQDHRFKYKTSLPTLLERIVKIVEQGLVDSLTNNSQPRDRDARSVISLSSWPWTMAKTSESGFTRSDYASGIPELDGLPNLVFMGIPQTRDQRVRAVAKIGKSTGSDLAVTIMMDEEGLSDKPSPTKEINFLATEVPVDLSPLIPKDSPSRTDVGNPSFGDPTYTNHVKRLRRQIDNKANTTLTSREVDSGSQNTLMNTLSAFANTITPASISNEYSKQETSTFLTTKAENANTSENATTASNHETSSEISIEPLSFGFTNAGESIDAVHPMAEVAPLAMTNDVINVTASANSTAIKKPVALADIFVLEINNIIDSFFLVAEFVPSHVGNNSTKNVQYSEEYSKVYKSSKALHFISLSILSVMVLETAIKLFCTGCAFFKKRFEVFDAFIVVSSFALDFVFLDSRWYETGKDATTILVLLLPWRVVRIVNSFLMTMKHKHHIQMMNMKRARKKAELKAAKLQTLLSEVRKDVQLLVALCRSNEIEEKDITACLYGKGRRSVTLSAMSTCTSLMLISTLGKDAVQEDDIYGKVFKEALNEGDSTEMNLEIQQAEMAAIDAAIELDEKIKARKKSKKYKSKKAKVKRSYTVPRRTASLDIPEPDINENDSNVFYINDGYLKASAQTTSPSNSVDFTGLPGCSAVSEEEEIQLQQHCNNHTANGPSALPGVRPMYQSTAAVRGVPVRKSSCSNSMVIYVPELDEPIEIPIKTQRKRKQSVHFDSNV